MELMDSDTDFDEPAAKFTIRSNDENLLGTFWNIVSLDKEIRLQNSEKLINILIEKQIECKAGEVSSDLQYAVERLVKGISSTRQGARQGFSITLALVLKKFEIVSLSQVLNLVEKHQPLTGSKSEKGHTVIGRALVYEAIVRSNRLNNESEILTSIVISLLALESQRSYIQVAVINIFNELLCQITYLKFELFIKPSIEDKLTVGFQKCTPLDMWLLLRCQKLFGNVIDTDFVLQHWGCVPIANQETFPEIGNVLKQAVLVHPIVHPLCQEIIEGVCNFGNLDQFWANVVEEILMEKNQFQRTFLAFELVKIVLNQDLSHNNVKTILSNNLISILMNNIKLKHHPLHSASEQLLDFLVKTIEETKDASRQLLILNSLLLPPGTLLTDGEIKAKYIKKIVQSLMPENLVEYGSILENIFKNGGTDLALNSDKILLGTIQCFALRELTSLIDQSTIEDDWKVNLLVKLFLWGHFTEKPNKTGLKDVIPDLSLSVIQASSQSFFRGIELYLRPKEKQGYHGRLNQTCESLIPLLDNLNGILESHDNFESQLEKTLIMEHWCSMYSMVKKLKKHSNKEPKDEDFKIFIALFVQVGFYLFSKKEANRAGEVIEELHECSKRLLKEKKHSTKNDTIDEDGPPWIAVLVDLFLTLLSEGSSHIRELVGSVFPLLGSRIDKKVLQQILDVILPEKEKDLVGEDDDMDKSEVDEDVEFDLASCSDDESSIDSSVMTEPDKAFVDKVAKALGPAADNEDDSDEEYLSDSEMFKLDDAISAAFRGRIKSKKMDEGEHFLMNFRMRCLDLINKYLKSEPPLSHILQCIPPLIAGLKFAIGNKNQTLFLKKILTALGTLTKTNKLRNVDNVTQPDLEKLFNELIEKLMKSTDLRISKEISGVCVYLVVSTKKIVHDDDAEVWYAGAFEKLVKEYFGNVKCHINQSFFMQLFQKCPEAASEVLESLSKYSFSDTLRLFQRTKSLMFLHCAATSVIQAKLDVASNKKYWAATWSNMMPKFVAALLEMSKGVKQTYMYELLSVGLLILEIRKNLSLGTDVSSEFLDAIQNSSFKKCDKRCKIVLKDLKKLIGIKNVASQKGSKRKGMRSKSKQELPDKLVKLEDESSTLFNGNSKIEIKSEPESEVDANILVSPSKKKKNKKNKHKNKGNILLVNGDGTSESVTEQTNVSSVKIKKKKKKIKKIKTQK